MGNILPQWARRLNEWLNVQPMAVLAPSVHRWTSEALEQLWSCTGGAKVFPAAPAASANASTAHIVVGPGARPRGGGLNRLILNYYITY